MTSQVKILLISFLATIIVSRIAIPILKKLKVRQNERDDGPKSHIKKSGTPTMGGIIILASIIIGSVGGILYYSWEQMEVVKSILPIICITVGFGFIGFLDDLIKLKRKDTKGLSPKSKMIGLLIISVAYILYLIKVLDIGLETYIPFLKIYIEFPIWAYIPFVIFVLLASTNAINLTDGVDGLASGTTAIIVTCFTVISILFDIKELIVFGSVITGVSLGFLLFNLYPAKVFMGDTGSLALGGAISAMAIYLKMPLLLAIICIVPIIETISVMIQVVYFKRTGNRIFKMAPIHHHLELSGWSEDRVVSFAIFTTLVACVVGIIAI